MPVAGWREQLIQGEHSVRRPHHVASNFPHKPRLLEGIASAPVRHRAAHRVNLGVTPRPLSALGDIWLKKRKSLPHRAAGQPAARADERVECDAKCEHGVVLVSCPMRLGVPASCHGRSPGDWRVVSQTLRHVAASCRVFKQTAKREGFGAVPMRVPAGTAVGDNTDIGCKLSRRTRSCQTGFHRGSMQRHAFPGDSLDLEDCRARGPRGLSQAEATDRGGASACARLVGQRACSGLGTTRPELSRGEE